MTGPTRRDVARRLDDLDDGAGDGEEIEVRILCGDVREAPQPLERMTETTVTHTAE